MLKSLRVAAVASISLFSACGSLPVSEYGAGSTTKEINIAIPKAEAFTSEKNLQAMITGYRFTISSKDEKCNHKTPYISKIVDTKISATILKSCDYEIELEFGKVSDDGLALVETYFAGEAALTQAEIAKQTADGSNSVGLEIILSATEVGRALGFTGEVKIESANLDISVKIQNHTQPVDPIDITGYAEKYKSSKADLSDYGKKYIELMNKIDHVSKSDQVKYLEISESLKGKVYIFDMHLRNFSLSSPNSKSFRFIPVTLESEEAIKSGNYLASGEEFELMTSTRDVNAFQPLAEKFKDLPFGTLVRIKVKIDGIGFLGSKITGEILEAEVLK